MKARYLGFVVFLGVSFFAVGTSFAIDNSDRQNSTRKRKVIPQSAAQSKQALPTSPSLPATQQPAAAAQQKSPQKPNLPSLPSFDPKNPYNGANLSSPGADEYNCPGDGSSKSSGPFQANKECSPECQNLEFDCSKHRLVVGGQEKEIDGEAWLGCAGQTGTQPPGATHKITGQGCGSGQSGLLPTTEPKLDSEPQPCSNCVIHRMPDGHETKGCLGLSGKLFDWVFKTCGGCTYKIVPEGSGGLRPPNSSSGKKVN